MRINRKLWSSVAALCALAVLVSTGCKPPPPKLDSGNSTTTAPSAEYLEPEIELGEPGEPQPVPGTTPEAESPSEQEPTEPADTPAEPAPPAETPADEPAPPADTPAEPADVPQGEPQAQAPSTDPAISNAVAAIDASNREIKPGDWSMWGGTSYRNNTPESNAEIPTTWDVGEFDRETNEWIKEEANNIKWVAALGSQSYGNVVVADGKVFAGTNNGNGWLKRYPSDVDLGCLLCFSEDDGSFLWQHSSEKLPTGRVHDWPLQGICSSSYVEGERLWFVSSRGKVICLDTEGYHDGEDDGPVQAEWAKQFELRAPVEEGEDDPLATATQSIEEGKVGPAIRAALAAVGKELAEGEIAIQAEEKGWTFTAAVDGKQREFHLRRQGPALVGYVVTTPDDTNEADTIWELDMMSELGISQHNMCSCSVVAWGDILFVNTGNGLDEAHIKLPAPNAPSFIAVNKNTGEVHWTDKSPGENILHGQWSSPAVAVLAGVPQVIFCGGDGWVYSFRADEGQDGKPTLLWKFDANPKTSKWILGGRGTRNNMIATPVIYNGMVYVAVGQDPEHGEGLGHLWCIDPSKRGDVSPELAVNVNDRSTPIPHKRLQAVVEEEGEIAVPNPNSAAVWHYSEVDQNGDGEIDFEEIMHRSCGTVAIKDDLLYIADFSGLFHCLDAKTGKPHFTYDMLASAWGTPLIVNGHVYIGDEDGDISVFKLDPSEKEPIEEINMGTSVYSTPVVANGVLFISNRTHIFAISEGGK